MPDPEKPNKPPEDVKRPWLGSLMDEIKKMQARTTELLKKRKEQRLDSR
jgi:hypothetical protein